MTNEIVEFRFSNSDFATYLIMLGYNPIKIEIIHDKKHNKPKAFIHFIGKKDIFINLQQQYENGNLLVNPKQFSIQRKKLNILIREKINSHISTLDK